MERNAILTFITGTVLAADIASAQNWIATRAPTNNYNGWNAVACSADGSKAVAASGGKTPSTIYTSSDSGMTWTTNAAPNQVWGSLASSADGRVVVASVASYIDTNLIYVSTNGASTWNPVTVPSLGSIACSADGRKWVASAGSNGVYTSANSGMSWSSNIVPSAYWSAVASSADGTRLLAVSTTDIPSYAYRIYVSQSSGATWSLSSAPALDWTSVASCADGKRQVAAATTTAYSPGAIYVSADSGTNWVPTSAPNYMWRSVAISADGSKLVAAAPYDNSAQVLVPVYISTNAGTTWTPIKSLSRLWEKVASSADGNRLFAISGFGEIWTWQTTPVLSLSVAASAREVALGWTVPSANFGLESSTDLTSWTNVPFTPVLNFSNLQNQVSFPRSNSFRFYRLKAH